MKRRKFNYKKIAPLFKQLISDMKPFPERLNLRIKIKELSKNDIMDFCQKNNDQIAFKKNV